MPYTESILDTCHLLAPHRQRLVLEAATAFLEMQLQLESGDRRHDLRRPPSGQPRSGL